MVKYDFQSIPVVPSASDFVDIILSRTQRQLPTVIRKGFKITRIRAFYMRKVKYTQQNFHERLSAIIEEFPRLDDMHPFYSDFMKVVYSSDHYKLALSQLNMARKLIQKLGKDYHSLLRYGDSLYRCKQLKRAALGRMVKIVRKLKPALGYLEHVRQHLVRLPAIDPTTRTLILTGYPNVGKSSFINKISNADVEVQPYAFTTKSLYVGHCYHSFMRWQIIDTPGILDHPIDERNTIEMQSVTALAHLQAAILFFIDFSETCKYSLEEQVSLFHDIKVLFQGKPVIIVASKSDMKTFDQLDARNQKLVMSMLGDPERAKSSPTGPRMLQMSSKSGDGVSQVKNTACDMLLNVLKTRKGQSTGKMNSILNRIQVTKPVRRDNRQRLPCIPDKVSQAREERKRNVSAEERYRQKSQRSEREGVYRHKKRTERDIELEHGGPGQYSTDLRKHWQLLNDEWKYDIIPEVMDGKNVADFYDPDIVQKMVALEQEEEQMLQEWLEKRSTVLGLEDSDVDEEEADLAAKIEDRRGIIKVTSEVNRSTKAQLPRAFREKSLDRLSAVLRRRGLDSSKFEDTMREQSRPKRRRGLERMEREMQEAEDEDGDAEMGSYNPYAARRRSGSSKKRSARSASPETKRERRASRARSRSIIKYDDTTQRQSRRVRNRSLSRATSRSASAHASRARSQFKSASQARESEKQLLKSQKKFQSRGKQSVSDRRIPTKKPKHLFSGKRGIGKTDRR